MSGFSVFLPLRRGVNVVLVVGSLGFFGFLQVFLGLSQLFWGQKLIFTVTALHEPNQTTTGILFCDVAPTRASELLCSEVWC